MIKKIKNWCRGEQLPPRKLFFEGKFHIVERNQRIRPPIIRFLVVLKFLLFHEKKYGAILIAITAPAIGLWGYLLAFDLPKITLTGTMPNETQWEIRKLGTILIFAMWFLSFLVLTFRFYRKYKSKGGISKKNFEAMQ